jgi:hypothetical protein
MTCLLGKVVIPCESQSAKHGGALGAQPRQSPSRAETSALGLPMFTNGSSRAASATTPSHPGRRGVDVRAATSAAPYVLGSPRVTSRPSLVAWATHTRRPGQKPVATSSAPFDPDARCLQNLGLFFGASRG